MLKAVQGEVFFYFSYGSNMLSKRILLRNKTASHQCVALLKDYKLCFGNYSNTWHGHVASIAKCEGDDVWGVMWTLNLADLDSLDRQEGVPWGVYRRLEVDVQTDRGAHRCYTYQLTRVDDEPDAVPSPHYKQVMLLGAAEHCLPTRYIDWLRSLSDNGYGGAVGIHGELGLPAPGESAQPAAAVPRQ